MRSRTKGHRSIQNLLGRLWTVSKTRTAQGAAARLAADTAANVVRPLFLLPLLIHRLGVGGYGEFVQLWLVVALASQLTALGLDHAIVREISIGLSLREINERVSAVLLLVALASTALPIILIALFRDGCVSFLIGPGADSHLLLPVVALIFLSALQVVGLATLQGQTRYRTSAALQALRAAMSVAAMALVALNARDLLNVMWAAVVAELLSLTIIRTILARSGQTLARPRLGTLIPMLTYGLPLAPASLLLITNQLLPRAVLAHSGPRGFELSGLFSVASVLISPINYLAGPLQFVLLPSAIRRRSSVEAPSRRLALRKVIMAFAFVSCILVAAGALAGRQLPHYYPRLTGFPSSMVTILLGLGAVLAGTARLASVEMCALNATASVLTAQVASTVTTCGLLLLTVPLCGLLGAATAVLAGSIALVAVIVYKWLRTSPPRTPGGNLPWRTADACET